MVFKSYLWHLLSGSENPGERGTTNRHGFEERWPRVCQKWFHVSSIKIAPDASQKSFLVGFAEAISACILRAILHRIILWNVNEREL